MTLTMARVDQKLIHGQVIAAWVPHLGIEEIIVVDEDVLSDALTQSILTAAVPPQVRQTCFAAPADLPKILQSRPHANRRLLLLFGDLSAVKAALDQGLRLENLNLGNQACQPNAECRKLSSCFFASSSDLAILDSLARAGLNLFFQSVPGDRPIPFCPADLTPSGGRPRTA
ncbi:MAG: PTS sugar transporter subunit IIB [Deltaproteobacteria bacterium]|jgi:mannose/fructose/N-acetylgalactosamine-specific phosphotransferase system component IIB|nr:PTS sugar transporter subunit IIB [Deltaproteobacteria bacterium]